MADTATQPLATSTDWRSIVFAVLIALHIVPIWITAHLVTQDGLAHVENAMLLRDLVFHKVPLASQFFRINPFPNPNLLGHVFLAVFMTGLPPLIAEKLLVTIYVVAMPLAVRYCIRAMRPTQQYAEFLAILILPFINGLTQHKGLYNFNLGLPLWFIAIGLWFKQSRQNQLFNAFKMAGTLLLLFFAHIVPFGLAVMTLAMLAIGRVMRERNLHALIDATITFNVPLPGVMLAIFYFMRHRSPDPDEHLPFGALFRQFVQLDALVSFTAIETYLARMLAMLFAVAIIVALVIAIRRTRIQRPAIAIAVLITIIFYLLAPNAGAGGGQLTFRLSLFPYFLAILWLAAQSQPRAWLDFICLVAGAISLVLLVDRTHSEQRISPMLDDYASVANHIKPGSTLWTEYPTGRDATIDGWKIARHVRPFIHANGLIATKTDIIDLTNYEAATDYFPLLFRTENSPARFLGKSDDDLLNYSRNTNGAGKVDYVLIWQSVKASDTARTANVRLQLVKGFEEVFRSPNGFATLYRARVFP